MAVLVACYSSNGGCDADSDGDCDWESSGSGRRQPCPLMVMVAIYVAWKHRNIKMDTGSSIS